MKTFKNFEEIKQYYNEDTNTYEFVENEQLLDVELIFELSVDSNIHAGNIKALNIKALNINAWDIDASDIDALGINARDINACNINAKDIFFYAVCFARKTFVCKSIKGQRDNNKYFCLDSDVVIKNENS